MRDLNEREILSVRRSRGRPHPVGSARRPAGAPRSARRRVATFSLFVSKKVFVLSLFLKDIFAGSRNFGRWFSLSEL